MTATIDGLKAHLREHGWVKIPSVITKEEAAHVLDRVWKAKAQSEASGEETYEPILDPNRQNVRVNFLPELDGKFRDLLADPVCLELAKSALGEKFLISNCVANIARPGSQSMCLHSDQSIVLPEPWFDAWAINFAWCLTKLTPENGATLYIPGSHRWTRSKDVPPNAPDLLIPFEAEAGDLIAVDGRLWHTSGCNMTKDEDRVIVFGYYTAAHMRQLVNWTARLPKDLQETLSPEMKELFGLGHIGYVVKGDTRYLTTQYPDYKPRVATVVA